MRTFERVIWIVLDSVGIGPLPDAAEYGDVPDAAGGDWRKGRNTLGHIAQKRAQQAAPLQLPTLERLGLANIEPLAGLAPSALPDGCFGKAATHSPGKDTTTGHWEMAGIWLDQAFPVYKNGFPPEIIGEFEKSTGRKTIGNKPASGTEIIKELGEEHVRTGFPIVYTSGDSVFQIAAHEEVIPITELYRMCEIARKILDGPHRVGRVIARPFLGAPGNFKRTERRHDYAVEPPRPMLLDVLDERKVPVFGVGKIHDIYNGRGVQDFVTTKNNADGMGKIRDAMQEQNAGLIFANLVDFDMLYGHRKDVEGFARSLEEFDALLGAIMPEFPPSDLLLTLEEYERWRGPSRRLKSTDLLLITADHGCDPDDCSPSTDHSREYVPIVAFSPSGNNGANLGTRATLADIGQTVAENFGARIPHGESFLAKLLKK